MNGQLRELLTNYGAIAGIWFDGMWDKPNADWHLDKNVRVDPPTPARGAHHSESSPIAEAWRRRANV